MYDAKDIVYAIKKMALEAVDARQDCDYIYGKVISEEPLIINIAQGIDLTNKQLVLTRNVTDYETSIVLDGTHTATIKNALKEGEIVVLLRKKGGQEYLVLDRVVEI